jgi:flavorubredoxin
MHGDWFPRELAEGVFWLGDCIEFEHEGQRVHSYHSAYVVAGTETSVLIDTGHPKDWLAIERQLDEVLRRGAPEVGYVFPTHSEVPHSANLGRLLKKFPGARACGDIRDYHLIFPAFEDRFMAMQAGDALDLGGTTFVLREAIVRDLVTSLWGYDTARRVLFPGDGFAYMHHHSEGECGKFAEELPDLPVPEFTAVFAHHALYWTRFTDIEPVIAELERLLADERVEVIAPAHGCPITRPQVTVPKVREGMRLGQAGQPAAA